MRDVPAAYVVGVMRQALAYDLLTDDEAAATLTFLETRRANLVSLIRPLTPNITQPSLLI